VTFEWIPAASDRFTPGRPAAPDTAVLHSTATTLAGAIATFQGGSRKVSAHLVIDVDRSVQMVDFADTAWHAGNWPWNQRSVGVEHVDNGDSWGPRPEALYVRSVEAGRLLRKDYGITRFPRHEVIVATACPAGLDTGRIIQGVMLDMAFDPRANPQDLAFLDNRIREIIMNEPALTGYALRRALQQYGVAPAHAKKIADSVGTKKKAPRRDVLKGHGRGRGGR
jgi:hypothetical protein